MTAPIKDLQTGLAYDLVKLENSDISEQQLQMIEDTYEQVYQILTQAYKE